MKRIFVLLMIMIGINPAAAQDTAVHLIPVRDSTFHLSGVAPEGWMNIGLGFYRRGEASNDPTLFGMQSGTSPAGTVLEDLLPQLKLEEVPQPINTLQSETLTWKLYRVDVDDVTVDLGMAQHDGMTYVVILQCAPDEYEVLHKAVFLPGVIALRPVVPVSETLPYTAEEVAFKNGTTLLTGTLTLPEGDGPFAAVILVSGSGAQDRDETIGSMKPFALIADGLTRAGLAVLRYDDQGVGSSSGDRDATIEETIANAAAAVEYLRTRADINAEQIGVLGHSEGGYVAAALGAHDKQVAFIIAMAGPAVNSKAVLREQNKRILKAEGVSDEAIQIQVSALPTIWDALEKDDRARYFDLIKKNTIAFVEALPEDRQAAIGDVEAFAKSMAEQQVRNYFNRWYKSFVAYDPTLDWEQVTIPVLAVYGGKDVQVPADQSAPALEAALKKAGNTDFQIVILPDANHMFQAAKTGAVSEYSTLDPILTPDFIPAIVDWLQSHVDLQGEQPLK